jgi:hypothetical protein
MITLTAINLPAIMLQFDNVVSKTGFTIQEQFDHAAAGMVHDMKARVTVKSGTLLRSIHWRRGFVKGKPSIEVRAAGPATTVRIRGGFGKFDYGKALEYGTHRQTQRPFFRPVLELWRKRIGKLMGRAAQAAVNQEFGK